jgi:riboflavin kinase/FMN adenylyltransferase
VRGGVVEGDRRGRGLGFPTLNLRPDNEILPAEGVYAGRVRFLDEGAPQRDAAFGAVTNVGRRPTFKAEDPVLAEAHLIDFDADAYGRRIELTFQHRLRAEQKFADVGALRAQIQKDVERGRKLLAGEG